MNSTSQSQLSIVIPMLNEERYLDQTLGALARQTAAAQDYEVLIYDGGSTDGSREIASRWREQFSRLRIQDNPGRLPAAGRNRGVQDAEGHLIAFVEGHCVVPANYVQRAIELFRETDADALGRPIDLVVSTDPAFQRYPPLELHPNFLSFFFSFVGDRPPVAWVFR